MAWYALVVGVDRYPAFRPQDQLSGCVNDANAVRQFLVGRVEVPEANVLSLVSPRTPTTALAATAANIRAEFTALQGRVNAGDHVVLFYAGHGVRVSRADSDQSHYGFVPEDAAPNGKRFTNLILGSEIHAPMVALERKGASTV
ncbi:MAG: caspase family protein [Acidimicrobiia bacterium]